MKASSLILLSSLLLLGAAVVFAGSHDSDFDDSQIIYPIAELGNCKDKAACFSYCDNPDNIGECVPFAERNGLMTAQEAKLALAMGTQTGPGGCRGRECEAYCANANIECMNFVLQPQNSQLLVLIAEEEGVDPAEFEQEMRMVQTALASGATLPAGCSGRECKDVCMNTTDVGIAGQCLAFAKAAGFMKDVPPGITDDVMIKMMIEGIKDPETGEVVCRGQECESVCMAAPDECMAGMRALGIDPMSMMPPEAKAQMEQMMSQVPPELQSEVQKLISEGRFDEIQDVMEEYFSEQFGGGFGPPGGFSMGGHGSPEDFLAAEGEEGGAPTEQALQQVPEEFRGMAQDLVKGGMTDPAAIQAAIQQQMFGGGYPGAGGFPGGMQMPPGMSIPTDIPVYGNESLGSKVLDTLGDLLGL